MAAQRRTAVAYVQARAGIACLWLAVSRAPVRRGAYQRHDGIPLRNRLLEPPEAHLLWGAPLRTSQFQHEAWRCNPKLIERVDRHDGLAVFKRRRKTLTRSRAPYVPAVASDERWMMDHLSNTLATGE